MRKLLVISFLMLAELNGFGQAKDYYFPIAELTESKIYKYECKLDPSKTEYWKITSNPTDNTLTTEAFDCGHVQYEFFKELLTKNGSELLEFISYRAYENGQKDTIINKPLELDVFKWDTNQVYHYSAESIEDNYGEIFFNKKREFLRKEKLIILGKEYEVLKFKGTYQTAFISTNKYYEKNQFSYYARGIGLVKMDKRYSDGRKTTLELTEIISMNEWSKLK